MRNPNSVQGIRPRVNAATHARLHDVATGSATPHTLQTQNTLPSDQTMSLEVPRSLLSQNILPSGKTMSPEVSRLLQTMQSRNSTRNTEIPTIDLVDTDSDRMAEENPENGNGSCTKELNKEQMKLHKAITQAIRSTNQEDLKKLLSPITRDISILINLKETIEQQTTEIQNIKLENNVLKQRCSQMEAEHDQLKLRVSVLENAKLEKNAIFYGLEESQWESDQDLTAKIYNYMAMTVKGDESTADKLAKVKKFKILEVSNTTS